MSKLSAKFLIPHLVYLKHQFDRQRKFVRIALTDLIFLLVIFQLFRTAGFTGFDFTLPILTTLAIFCACILFVTDDADWSARLESDLHAEKEWPTKWIYAALSLIVLAGIIFKLIHINDIGVYTDEWGSLVDAYSVADHGNTVYFVNGHPTEPYSRALFLIYLTGFFIRWFGHSLLVARLPVIIISSLTAVPLYLLGAKFSKKVGMLSAILWLLSPWGMMIGRFVREYAVFPCFYLFIFWMLICFSDVLLKRIEHREKLTLRECLVGGFGFGFPLYYFMVLDKFSTFEQVLVVYAVSFLYFAYIAFRSKTARAYFSRKRVIAAVLAGAFLLMTYIYLHRSGISWWEMDFWPSYSSTWFKKILGDRSRSWFYLSGAYSVFLVMAFGSFPALLLFLKQKYPWALFYTLTFFASFYVYTFHFARYIRARYGFVMHVFLIPILALGIYFMYLLLWPKKGGSRLISALLTVFVLLTFNPLNTYQAVFTEGSRYDMITEEHLYKFDEVAQKYGSEMKDQVILCTTCNPLFWFGIADLHDNKVQRMVLNEDDLTSTQRAILEAQKIYDHGWIILDQWRFRKEGLILELPIRINNYVFDYVDHIYSFFIYRW